MVAPIETVMGAEELSVFHSLEAAGWNHAANLMPPHANVEHLPPLAQVAYERGRLNAVNVRAAGMHDVPFWPFGTSMPNNVWECIRRANNLVGPATIPSIIERDSKYYRI